MLLDVSVNGQVQALELTGTGNFELVELYRAGLSGQIKLEIVSAADGCGVRMDGLVVGKADLQAEEITFAPLGRAVEPKFSDGPIENCDVISGEGLDYSYAVWWNRKESISGR